jgi:choline dehydrogenase-like flavoprotein
MLETYIPDAAIQGGARILVNCHAVGIETAGRTATAVRCRLNDGSQIQVTARSVVIACGAIGSSVLLLKSGIKRNVGSRFSFNAGTPMFARFARELNGFQGAQMAAYVDFGEVHAGEPFQSSHGLCGVVAGLVWAALRSNEKLQ